MSEEWSCDESGFISNGREFFNIKFVVYIGKTDNNSILVHLTYLQLRAELPNQTDRDAVFGFFMEAMRKYHDADIAERERNKNYQDAVLATQKQIVGTHLENIK